MNILTFYSLLVHFFLFGEQFHVRNLVFCRNSADEFAGEELTDQFLQDCMLLDEVLVSFENGIKLLDLKAS
jgi:hypothetical protein